MSPKKLHQNQPIRPAPPREISISTRFGAAGSVLSPQTTVPAKRRGPQTTLACDACRIRKTKCDGRKPCEACRAKTSQCHYDKEGREKNKTSALRSQIADLRALVKRVSDGSDEEVTEIRRQLKAGCDISRIVKDLYPIQYQLDATESERSATPEVSVITAQRLPSIDFLSSGTRIAEIEERWRLPTRLELFRIARHRAMLDAVSTDSDEESGELNFTINIPKTYAFPAAFQQIPLVERPCVCIRGLLQTVTNKAASPFLLVESPFKAHFSSMDVSQLICVWLSYHAFVNPYVHPGQLVASFVDTGRSGEDKGTLIQASILALACLYMPHSKKQSDFEQERMIRFFRSEAETSWRSQKGRATLSNIQALIAQYEYDKMSGKDRVGWHLLNNALDMAQDMGIHAVHDQQDFDCLDSADAFGAWGVFNYQAIESLLYGKPPQILRCWTERPRKIIPSQMIDAWQAFRLSNDVLNSSFWDHWEALCNLSDIIVEATGFLFGDRIDGFAVPRSVVIAQTQHSRYRLNEWRRSLPDTLALFCNKLPHNLWLHMTYYALTIALHRPYVEDSRLVTEEPRDVVLHSRNIMVESARNIIHLAMISLERYTSDLSPAQNVQMVATAAFVLVQDLDDEASRKDMLIAASILHHQGHRFTLAAALARAVLLVAQDAAIVKLKTYPDIEVAIRENLTIGSRGLSQGEVGSIGCRQRTEGSLGEYVHSSFPTFVKLEARSCKRFFGQQMRAGESRLSEVLQLLEKRVG